MDEYLRLQDTYMKLEEKYDECKKSFQKRLEELGKTNSTKSSIYLETMKHVKMEPIVYTFDIGNIGNINDKVDKDELKRLYRKLVLLHHPDKGGDVNIFIRIQKAYEDEDIVTLQNIEKGNNTSSYGESFVLNINIKDFPSMFDIEIMRLKTKIMELEYSSEIRWFNCEEKWRYLIEDEYFSLEDELRFRTDFLCRLALIKSGEGSGDLYGWIYAWK